MATSEGKAAGAPSRAPTVQEILSDPIITLANKYWAPVRPYSDGGSGR